MVSDLGIWILYEYSEKGACGIYVSLCMIGYASDLYACDSIPNCDER